MSYEAIDRNAPRAPLAGGLTARVHPRTPLWPFLLVSSLGHMLLVPLLGRALLRPGSGAPGILGLEPGPGFERAWPGVAGLPPGARLGVVDLGVDLGEEPRIQIIPMTKATSPVAAERVEPKAIPEPVPVLEPPTLEPAAGAGEVAGDPAGSPVAGSGEAGGDGGNGGGGGGGGQGAGGGGAGEAFVPGRDTLPVVQSMTLPDYPEEAKGRSRVPVVLQVHVTADGRVDEVQVAEPSGCAPCERAAIASAWKLRFTPGTRAGLPVPMWIRYPVTFGRK